MIGLEERMNVFHLLGERRFLKNRFITAHLWALLEGNYGCWGIRYLDFFLKKC